MSEEKMFSRSEIEVRNGDGYGSGEVRIVNGGVRVTSNDISG